MKFEKAELRPRLLELIAAGRETAAAPIAPEKLRERLTDVAKVGFSECRIWPLAPVDVRSTNSAKAAEKFLEQLRFSFTWEPQVPPADNVAGGRTEFYILVVQLS